MTSEVIYNGNLRTTATHLRSGNSIITDAPVDNHGNGEAFSPTDLMATSLASCMITIMGIKARDKNIDITGTKASVEKIMGSEPRRIAAINIIITMPPNTYTDKEKKILEGAAHGCPVGKSIHPDLDENIKFIWS